MFLNPKRFLTLLFLLPLVTFALPDDSEKTLHIVANSYIFNYKTGIDEYEGDVKVDQGSTHLIADRVVTEKDKERKIISAIAYGLVNPAEFSTTPRKGDIPFHAKAKVIKFYPPASLVELEENVIVTQGENSFQGPIIVYNMKDQIVTTPASEKGRATIIIDPKQLKSSS
jgi:lipopolysaccharide export system protein LptA